MYNIGTGSFALKQDIGLFQNMREITNYYADPNIIHSNTKHMSTIQFQASNTNRDNIHLIHD